MKRYEKMLQEKGVETLYLDYDAKRGSLQSRLSELGRSMTSSPRKFIATEPTDFMLEKRLYRICEQAGLEISFVPTPGFINQQHENQEYRAG